MKKLYLFAALAAMLAACSENDLTVEKQSPQTQQSEGQAIDFDVYVNRGITRAGLNGPISTLSLSTGAHSAAGFGVFGYYTNGESYTGSSRPDFFYNQQVYYSVDHWTYSPIKYWPNEFGNDAISDQVDKVTLFAYAPWVEVTPLTGLVKNDGATNIIGMTRNNATGDPLIKYVSSMMSDNSVDLCYGVAAQHFTSSNSAYNQNDRAAGTPYIDIVKPGLDKNSKIKFDFRHALAQLNVTIDAKVVDWTNGNPASTVKTDYTRIWVRSITFEGITMSGALNLNSNSDSPNWYDVNGTSLITTGSLTVYDGRKDGREANEIASSEKPATLNPEIVQSEPYPASGNFSSKPTAAGVTSETLNLFCKANGTKNPDVNAPIFVIPTKEKMKVIIVYDVETADENLATVLSDGSRKGSTIENRIYKTIDAFSYIEAGKKYTLNLHLGMRTVDFDAQVTPWVDYGSDIDLPSNLQTFAAKPTGDAATGDITLAAGATSYEFAVSGLKPNSTITPTVSTQVGSTTNLPVATPSNGSGISIIKVTGIAANGGVLNNTGVWTVTDGTNTITLNVTQVAGALGLEATAIANSGDAPDDVTNITIGKDASTGWNNTTAFPTDATISDHIKVTKNGVSLQVVTGDPTAGQVKFDTSGKLVVKGTAAVGDIYTIWMQAGNAAPEKITRQVGGVYFTAPTTTVAVGGKVTNEAKWIGTKSSLVYESEDTDKATVADGEVTGVAVGTSKITATLTPVETNGTDGYLYLSATPKDEYTITFVTP